MGRYKRKEGELFEAFWAKVDRHGPISEVCPELGQCWVWKGALGAGGYGNAWDGESIVPAHVLSYEMAYGPVPEGLEVCHRCNNKRCVRPEHIHAATHQFNMDYIADTGGTTMKKRFTEETQAKMREMYHAGHTRPEIAEAFGCSRGTVSNALTGIRKYVWKPNLTHKVIWDDWQWWFSHTPEQRLAMITVMRAAVE